MRRTTHALFLTALIMGLCAVAPTQTGPMRPAPLKPMIPSFRTHFERPNPRLLPGPTATMHFQTNIGSFKTIDGVGKISMSFKGTVLISDFQGAEPPKLEGDVHLQYQGHNRLVYFGTGRMTVDGNWRAIQWFGRDLKADWTGRGMIRLIGEFDKNLDTGTYYYEDPKNVLYWPTSVMPISVPERKLGGGIVEPRARTEKDSSTAK